MAVNTFEFTTGPATLQNVGKLAYNGCVFSPLYETKVSGKVVKDNANRTTKFMEYTLTADGYVTLPANAQDINPTIRKLRNLLTAQGGMLTYIGRGFDLVVNAGGGIVGIPNLGKPKGLINPDVAWGPVPELIEFQPLGGGRSAKVQWKVTVRIPEIASKTLGLLQLNYETGVSYGEDGFSSISVRGTLEVPMTRSPSQATRKLTYTVDDYRNLLSERILGSIDLSRFRVVQREFNVSRDKRTLEWDVAAEERPYMDPPMDCTIARGNYNVRPVKAGMGLVSWLCTLKATYTVRNDSPRRAAWLAFLALVRLRMKKSEAFNPPEIDGPAEEPGFWNRTGRALGRALPGIALMLIPGAQTAGAALAALGVLTGSPDPKKEGIENPNRKVWLIDFSVDEGLYLDSKTITFSATWRLISNFQHILVTSGLWTKVAEEDLPGRNLWAASMKNLSGHQSWLQNRLNPKLDVIVDFGSDA